MTRLPFSGVSASLRFRTLAATIGLHQTEPCSSHRLRDIAPRLARARDQFFAHRAEESRIELAIASHRLELQRLVAHRELQLVRAYSTGNGRYIVKRARMLESARKRLAGLERVAAQERAA